MEPFESYQKYLALKNHFTNKKYNYFTYNGKVKANLQSFYKRKDRFWFEKLSRNKTDEEILNFFVANFASCDDPQSLWIGQIIKEGEENYTNWMRKTQSLSYIFKEEIGIFNSKNFDEMFSIQGNKHPLIIKNYLQKKISLETLIILNNILEYTKEFDKKLQDPVWEFISMRIQKYTPFIHIDVNKFKQLLKECVL
ncbi:hypothetical protein MUO66_03235 [Candidatus Bathyarchaeota archaeon]|nr:hypothetical protein [Candidatus Bathyarchaeota archaeon]